MADDIQSSFSGNFSILQTLRENLIFHRSIEDKDLIKGLRFCCAFGGCKKSFKKGLDTLVEKKGSAESRSKQRVSIARAYLDSALVWILDDCFSALDTVTEERILQNLLREKRNRTVFFMFPSRINIEALRQNIGI